jgi:sulfate permease, SulP family
MRLLPAWLSEYQRAWLVPDVVAGLVVWSVVVPQAVAYAQIAGLPPSAGLAAAPGALLAYGLLGTSRSLVVSATTATAAVSATAAGRLADGDGATFAALSAGLAVVTAAVLVGAGLLRLGGVTDLISKPVLTGFLFGLGLTIAVGQLPKLFGVPGGSGHFFQKLWDLLTQLGDTHWRTLVVGGAGVALLVVLPRLSRQIPATLVVLVLSIAVSKGFDLSGHGVDVVGNLPSAVPDPAVPDVSWREIVELLPAAFGIMLLVCAEGIGVARSVASTHGYAIDPNRELVAVGGSNLLAGLSSGFVQSGGASQTAAADRAGGKTQLASLVAAAFVLLTGAFLAFLFEDLPQATLGAIVIVAVAGFFRVAELERFARIRRSALLLALVALVGVLLFGILAGLVIAAGLSLVVVIQRLSRPSVGALSRDPETGAWGRSDRHPDWLSVPGVLAARTDGPLFYANAANVKERLLGIVREAEPRPEAVILDLGATHDLDVESLDTLGELADALAAEGVELRFAAVHAPVLELLRRGGLSARVRIEPTLDAATGHDHPSESLHG